MRDPGLDAGGTIAVNRFTFGCPIKALLQFRKKLGGLIFFSGFHQGNQLLLGVPGGLQKCPVHFTTADGGTGLFGSRGGICHKEKECPNRAVSVNP